jgi:hypothetical protein
MENVGVLGNNVVDVEEDEPCEFTLDDWFDLFFPPDREGNGYMCMVFQTFLDDSGHKAKKLMVSAGFCANREVWADFRKDWESARLRHGLDYFKSSECNHVDGQFRKFRKGERAQADDREQARVIREDFLGVIARHRGIVGVGVAVELSPYERLALLPEAQGVLPRDPYKAALSSVMFETVKRVRSRDRNCMVAFTHDDGDEENLFASYQEFRKMNPNTAKHLGGFGFLNDKLTAELQAGDLIANHAAYIGSKNPDVRAGLVEMRENIAFLARWDEPYIAAILKRGLRKRGEPIPLEFED